MYWLLQVALGFDVGYLRCGRWWCAGCLICGWLVFGGLWFGFVVSICALRCGGCLLWNCYCTCWFGLRLRVVVLSGLLFGCAYCFCGLCTLIVLYTTITHPLFVSF